MVKGRRKILIAVAVVYVFIFATLSCSEDEGFSPYQWLETGEEFSGGSATVLDASVNAFSNPAPNLQGDKDLQFVTGNAIFNRNWVTAPSSTEDMDGLGPHFIARSCSACHFKDGRGNPPLTPDEKPVSLLFRLSVPGTSGTGGPLPEPHYGDQLNTNAILGVKPEGSVKITYREIPGQYPDGTSYSLREPRYEFTDLGYGDMSPDVLFSPRIAQQMIGLGLLEAIDEAAIHSWEDPEDANHDGISGRANQVWDYETHQLTLGRYGWKANQPNVRQQVAAAFVGDIGITSSVFKSEACTAAEQDCGQGSSGGQPELKESILEKVTLYTAALAVPKRRDWDTPEVLRGKQLFFEANCTGCHLPKVTTGEHPDFPEFSHQTIRPYTDMLLHDMGEGLADGRPDYLATGREWRTPPLWGIGLVEVVNGHTLYLHDGRARNLEEAILWHGGEAAQARQAFVQMKQQDREALIEFLKSL